MTTLRGDKQCPHGYTKRAACWDCVNEDLARAERAIDVALEALRILGIKADSPNIGIIELGEQRDVAVRTMNEAVSKGRALELDAGRALDRLPRPGLAAAETLMSHQSSNQEVDWTEVIEKMTDDLERTRNLLETKTSAWQGALQANANLHEKIAAHETTIRRLADDSCALHDDNKQLRAALRRYGRHESPAQAPSCQKTWIGHRGPCTCGLDEILGEQPVETKDVPPQRG